MSSNASKESKKALKLQYGDILRNFAVAGLVLGILTLIFSIPLLVLVYVNKATTKAGIGSVVTGLVAGVCHIIVGAWGVNGFRNDAMSKLIVHLIINILSALFDVAMVGISGYFMFGSAAAIAEKKENAPPHIYAMVAISALLFIAGTAHIVMAVATAAFVSDEMCCVNRNTVDVEEIDVCPMHEKEFSDESGTARSNSSDDPLMKYTVITMTSLPSPMTGRPPPRQQQQQQEPQQQQPTQIRVPIPIPVPVPVTVSGSKPMSKANHAAAYIPKRTSVEPTSQQSSSTGLSPPPSLDSNPSGGTPKFTRPIAGLKKRMDQDREKIQDRMNMAPPKTQNRMTVTQPTMQRQTKMVPPAMKDRESASPQGRMLATRVKSRRSKLVTQSGVGASLNATIN